MTDDNGIIDLTPYLDGAQDGFEDTFAVHGGSGAASRFALPVWRSVYRLRGARGMLAVARDLGGVIEPLFVLDLRSDPARREVPASAEAHMRSRQSHARLTHSADDGGWVCVRLGEDGGDLYHLVVFGVQDPALLEDPDVRRDLLFLAGECSGLVMHWGLHAGGRATSPDPV